MKNLLLRATYTGTPISLLDPDPQSINPLDILVPLSRIERWNGHCLIRGYTVGQHSIHVSDSLPRPFRLKGFAHDWIEAYLGDISRPIKEFLGERWLELERRFEWAVCQRFRIPEPLVPDEVKCVDDRMMATEARDLVARQVEPIGSNPYLDRVVPWKSKLVLPALVDLFEELTGEDIDRRLLPMSRGKFLSGFFPFLNPLKRQTAA